MSTFAQNTLGREFHAERPNQRWIADFTYIWTAEGWLYVAAVIDLFSRRGVGWSMKAAMTAGLVTDALMMTIWRRESRMPCCTIRTVNRSRPVPGRSVSNTDRPFGRLAPQGAPCGLTRIPIDPPVSFPGPVGGETIECRCAPIPDMGCLPET